MKRSITTAVGVALVVMVAACDDYLTTQPQTVILDEQIWNDPTLVRNVLADLYDRVPLHQGLEQDNLIVGNGGGSWLEFTSFDEALYSGVTAGYQVRNSYLNYPYSTWDIWDDAYELIRDANLAIERVTDGTITDAVKQQLLAELRFVRAQVYFELVKRYGGVPIITEQLIYDFSGDPSSLQRPRNTEAQVYDFIADEMDAIAPRLENEDSQRRANRWSALALKSRAMLYAGSIARNGLVSLPGGEVGIPADRANEYFQASLDASREIIENGPYTLVQGTDPTEAFLQVFLNKGNSEVILAKDYNVAQGKKHFFTMQAYPQSIAHQPFANWGGGAISPSLNLVENYDYLDGSSGELRGVGDGTVAGRANWIFYDRPEDIFAGKDHRMFATVMTPGSSFAGSPLRFQAGVMIYDPATGGYERQAGTKGSTFSDGGTLTGLDGPITGEVYTSVTGFYIRKYMDPTPAGAQATGTDTWWVLYRLGEIYLNAAEAAVELGQDGGLYISALRERAGFPPNSMPAPTISDIRRERWNELAFEDHRVWDLRRWRTAHVIWDGSPQSETAVVYALYPYRVVGGPNAGKYVFDRIPSPVQTAPRFFRMGNYYTAIPDDVISANPLLVRNPFH